MKFDLQNVMESIFLRQENCTVNPISVSVDMFTMSRNSLLMLKSIYTTLMLNCSVKGRRENQHLKITAESAVTVLGILHTCHFISKKHTLFLGGLSG